MATQKTKWMCKWLLMRYVLDFIFIAAKRIKTAPKMNSLHKCERQKNTSVKVNFSCFFCAKLLFATTSMPYSINIIMLLNSMEEKKTWLEKDLNRWNEFLQLCCLLYTAFSNLISSFPCIENGNKSYALPSNHFNLNVSFKFHVKSAFFDFKWREISYAIVKMHFRDWTIFCEKKHSILLQYLWLPMYNGIWFKLQLRSKIWPVHVLINFVF